jgi:hypothetical protein
MPTFCSSMLITANENNSIGMLDPFRQCQSVHTINNAHDESVNTITYVCPWWVLLSLDIQILQRLHLRNGFG